MRASSSGHGLLKMQRPTEFTSVNLNGRDQLRNFGTDVTTILKYCMFVFLALQPTVVVFSQPGSWL
jgi:NhaP-type Na+/H+ or K+/H+ antiporter